MHTNRALVVLSFLFATSAGAQDAAMQARGKQAMGVDQYASTHKFDDLAMGGRIELQSDRDDSVAVSTIRQHMHDIATAFKTGDFSTPAFVHMKTVPGTADMARLRAKIT